MSSASEGTRRYIYLGALHGAVAWSAYAIEEFIVSSVLFRLVRPYAMFTSWHWQLTAMLMAGFLAAGLLTGGFAGLTVKFIRRKTDWLQHADSGLVLEGATTLTVVLAFAINLLCTPTWQTGKPALLILSIALSGLLVTSMFSQKWSERLGLLANPWIVAGLLLGAGQGIGLLRMQDLARQLGTNVWLWSGVLVGALLAVAIGSVLIGRRLRPHLARDRFTLIAPSWAALCIAVLLLVGSKWLAAAPASESRSIAGVANSSAQPNVVVIVMDTVRADHFSLNGYERDTTPNLKVLARDSTVYTQAIAPSDMTLTSHASLFTGMYPSWHGAYCQPPDATYGSELSAQVPTLAEILSKKGFSTVGVAANLYLRADFGLQRGFESFRIPRPVPVLGADEGWYLLRVGMRRLMTPFTDTSQFDRLFSRGEDINREMFKLLSKQGKTPFFAFLNYMDAHFPYIPPAPFDRKFPGKINHIVEQDLQEIQDKVMHGEPMPSTESRHLLSQYDGGIAYTDAQIGAVMNWLKERHLYDNSLIVVTSDHGEGFGEKNLVLHGNSVYQNLLHVGLLIKFPKAAHTGVVNDPVSLIDVAPTIVNALGYAAPANMQGKNLLDKAADGPRQIFSESFQCPVPHPPECPSEGCMSRSVLAWPYKLVTSSGGKFELYDVSNDAGENRNLAVSQSAAAKELGSELSRWVKTMPPRAKQQLKLDGEAVQKLKSLGYVQ